MHVKTNTNMIKAGIVDPKKVGSCCNRERCFGCCNVARYRMCNYY